MWEWNYYSVFWRLPALSSGFMWQMAWLSNVLMLIIINPVPTSQEQLSGDLYINISKYAVLLYTIMACRIVKVSCCPFNSIPKPNCVELKFLQGWLIAETVIIPDSSRDFNTCWEKRFPVVWKYVQIWFQHIIVQKSMNTLFKWQLTYF
jgi:hypothetical protein